MPSWTAVATPADPERYLRLLAERTLRDGERLPPWGGTVEQVGRALVSAGVLDASVADTVAYEHAVACAERGLGLQPRRWWMQRAAGPRLSLSAPVVRPGPVTATLPWAEVSVRYVRFCPTETQVAVIAPAAAATDDPPVWFGGAPSLHVADDRGTSGTAPFHGTIGVDALQGRFSVPQALSPATAWLQLDGVRVDLPHRPPPEVTVTVEDLPPTSPAVAHLRHRLALSPHLFEKGLADDAVMKALVAVGAVDPADPDVQTIRLVAAALDRSRHGERVAWSELPDPWASLMTAAQPAVGAAGVVPVAAVTPPVDGVVAAIDAVDAQPDGLGFRVDVTVTPGRGLMGRMPGRGETLAWWAVDDRGGVHLGHPGSTAGSGQLAGSTITFAGGIDPLATELRLLPTGPTQRAIVRVPLRWQDPPEPSWDQ